MTNTITIPLAEYLPDLPDYPAQGSSNIRNCYPRTLQSYGAIPAPMPFYGPLLKRCQGGAGFHDRDAENFIFAGDANDLYVMKAGLTTWQNASKSSGIYSVDPEEQWQFAYFNGEVLAVNFNTTPQVFTLPSSSTFTDLSGDAPRAHFISVVKNAFVVLANTLDTTNGHMPQRVWWSGAGNARSWPLPGTNEAAAVQSGATDLLGPGGDISGFASNLISADAIVVQELAVRRMQYAGPPDIFTFLPIENARGSPAPYSIVVNGGVAYYWGQDGIDACDGGSSVPIGANKVDKTVFAGLDQAHLKRVVGVADPFLKTIWWAYPSPGAQNPDRLLAYNYTLDRFTISDVTCETLIRFLSLGVTLDELFTIFGYTLDTVPAPLDSSIWLGGRPQFGLFDTDHKLNYLSGTPLTATIETSELQAAPGRRALITSARPLVDGTNTIATVSIGHRERLQEAPTYGPNSSVNKLGACPQRASGRYIRAKTIIPASNTWVDFAGVDVDVVNQGKR